jgi:predicted amidohydrolase YtcJ
VDLDILDVTIFDGRTIRPENRVSIRDGIITEIATGPAQVPADRTITATGRLLTPGFVDAHVHTTFGGQESLSCDLSSADGLAETLDLIRGHIAADTRRLRPLHTTGSSAADGRWPTSPEATPTADILDAVCPDRPALLLSADHHSAWVNTAALTVAGIDAATESPAGGIIVADRLRHSDRVSSRIGDRPRLRPRSRGHRCRGPRRPARRAELPQFPRRHRVDGRHRRRLRRAPRPL